MRKFALFVYNGDPMCFIHVLLNGLDLKAKGMDEGFAAQWGGAPSSVPAAVLAWLATSDEAKELNGELILAQRVALKALPGQHATQIRMALKFDTEHVVDFTLVPGGRRPDAGDTGGGWRFACQRDRQAVSSGFVAANCLRRIQPREPAPNR